MSDAADRAAAKAELKRKVQDTLDPALSDPEIEAILDEVKAASTFAASTVYAYGQLVVPSARNGRRYRVAVGGTSGASEPTWPDYEYGTVTSGGVTFEEDGSAASNIYDVRRACYLAWDLKAAKATNKDQYLQDARGQASSFLYLNCVRERDKYAGVGVA